MTQPPPRQIESWRAAEDNAAEWMRHWGYTDATVTPGGPDAGIDVRSAGVLAQVKWEGHQTGMPALQKLVGARRMEHDKTLLFFSGAGYSTPAVDYADDMDIALFKCALDGRPTPKRLAAHRLVLRHERESTSLAGPAGSASSMTSPHADRPATAFPYATQIAAGTTTATDAAARLNAALRRPGRGWLGRNWTLLVAAWFWLATVVNGLAQLRGEPRPGIDWWDPIVTLIGGVVFTAIWFRSSQKRARWKQQRASKPAGTG